MMKTTIFTSLFLAVCVSCSVLPAALVVTFSPAIVPAAGFTFTDVSVNVTNTGPGAVNVNAFRFNVALSGVGAAFAIFDAPSTYRPTTAYLLSPDPVTVGKASDAQFLVLAPGNTLATFTDGAMLPNIAIGAQNNHRTLNVGESSLVGKLRINFDSPLEGPYSFSLTATGLSGGGNEFGGIPFGANSYTGFGFASNPGGGNSMSNQGFSQISGVFNISAVPEPSSLILIGLAASCFGGRRWSKIRAQKQA